jgi:hypothetical protein
MLHMSITAYGYLVDCTVNLMIGFIAFETNIFNEHISLLQPAETHEGWDDQRWNFAAFTCTYNLQHSNQVHVAILKLLELPLPNIGESKFYR